MFDSSLKKAFVPSLLSTGAVFAALASPVFMFGNETMKIEQGQQSRWKGTVREVAAPYLALAGATSVGLGVSSVAIAGWRRASQQAERIDEAMQSQQQQFQQRELHIQSTLMSKQYLAKTGLDFFLDEEEATPIAFEPEKLAQTKAAKAPVAASHSLSAPRVSQPLLHKSEVHQHHADAFEQAIAEFQKPAVEPAISVEPTPARPTTVKHERRNSDRRLKPASVKAPVIQAQPTEPIQPIVITPAVQTSVQSTITPLTAAQGFLGFNRVTAQPQQPSWNAASVAQDHVTIEKIQSLQNQLQQIVSQIEALQVNLTPSSTVEEAVSALDQQAMANPVAPVDRQSPAWVVRRAAS